MSAPTLDRHPGSSQAGSSEGRRRRRTLVLVASALIVLALAVGTSLAIATRPVARQAPASATPAAGAGDQNDNTNTDQGRNETQGQDDTGTAGGTGSGSEGSGAGTAAPVLPDGETTAYITKVASGRIVVDVVQVFHDDEAVKAAVADGKSPSDAKYLTTYVRNENPRLRTVPLAGDLEVKLRDACGEPGNNRQAQLTRLAANASLKGTYYYTLSVSDGTVERIEERLAVNAC
jgi:hypothetical protein